MKKVKTIIEVLSIITGLIETYWYIESFIESRRKAKPVKGFRKETSSL